MDILKRRHERRHELVETVPARVLLRSLAHGKRGVDAVVGDASKTGLGILVQENIALDSKCIVEIFGPKAEIEFQGEVCYARRTESGIRLGILIEADSKPVTERLGDAGIELKP